MHTENDTLQTLTVEVQGHSYGLVLVRSIENSTLTYFQISNPISRFDLEKKKSWAAENSVDLEFLEPASEVFDVPARLHFWSISIIKPVL